MKKWIYLFAFLFLPWSAQAACHLYLQPKLGSGTPLKDPFRPKYQYPGGYIWYGGQPVYLTAMDTDSATDKTIAADKQASKIPDDLDQEIGAAALNTVQGILEVMQIPAHWVTAQTTYRTLLRTTINMMAFFQRFTAVTGITSAAIDGSNVTLNTQFQQLTANARNGLIDTAKSLGLDTSGITATATVRQIMKAIADQMGSGPVTLGCATI